MPSGLFFSDRLAPLIVVCHWPQRPLAGGSWYAWETGNCPWCSPPRQTAAALTTRNLNHFTRPACGLRDGAVLCLSVEVAQDQTPLNNDRPPLPVISPVEQDRMSLPVCVECIAHRLSCRASAHRQRGLSTTLDISTFHGYDQAVCADRSSTLDRNWLGYGRNFPHAISSSSPMRAGLFVAVVALPGLLSSSAPLIALAFPGF
jgi:hypothetical protein